MWNGSAISPLTVYVSINQNSLDDSSAYQYVTATLDLSLTDQDNLLISDTDGELLTTARLPAPHRR